MDRRIIKTKESLKNAFFTLKKEKTIEKISVKELCELADINKSTFYIHYTDIHDLSRQLCREAVREIIRSIPQDEEYTFLNPELFTQQLVLYSILLNSIYICLLLV
mgnify:CR=1 FL=1